MNPQKKPEQTEKGFVGTSTWSAGQHRGPAPYLLRADNHKLLAETYSPLTEWLAQPSKEDPWVGIDLIILDEHSSSPTKEPKRHENEMMESDSNSVRVELGSVGEC